jgi:SAM-dependent methyltransferase
MKNIANELPTDTLAGRTLFSTKFVDNKDIRGRNILDIGCGFGWFENFSVAKNASSITGLELTNKDLDTARKNLHFKNVHFKTGSAIKLPFVDSSFNTVVSWEVLEHIPKGCEDKMFAETFRVLAPGGTLYISTPNSSPIAKLLDPAWILTGHRHYKVSSVIEHATSAGFSLDEAIVRGGIWELVGMLNLYIAKWIFKRRPFFEKYFIKKQNLEYNSKNGLATIFAKFSKPGN